MNKTLYIVRHCEAMGQNSLAPLTKSGEMQAISLAENLTNTKIEQIISSPFVRARQSILPYANKFGLDINLDNRLIEQKLNEDPTLDTDENIRESFEKFNVSVCGGESCQEAMARIVEITNEIYNHSINITAIVTHGLLMTLLLKYYNNNIGFEDFKRLTRPDIYRIINNNGNISIEHY